MPRPGYLYLPANADIQPSGMSAGGYSILLAQSNHGKREMSHLDEHNSTEQ